MAKATADGQFRSERLENTLRTLHLAVQGIKASVIVNIDGLLVSAYPATDDEDFHRNPTSSPQVAAMAATLVGLADRTLKRLEQGTMKRLFMEAEEGSMVIYPAGGALLAVLVDNDTQLGMVIFAAKKATEQIKEILGFKDEE